MILISTLLPYGLAGLVSSVSYMAEKTFLQIVTPARPSQCLDIMFSFPKWSETCAATRIVVSTESDLIN